MKYFNSKNQIAGESRDGIFFKTVKRKIHLMLKFDAYGIDKRIFGKFAEDDVHEVRVFETDTRKSYKSTVEKWHMYGIIRDFGDGEQIFLPLKHWTPCTD